MNPKLSALGAILALAAMVGAAQAQTITVDIEDASIFEVPSIATIADLPGPDGHISFGEAMVASNNTHGRQTVAGALAVHSGVTLQPDWALIGQHCVVGGGQVQEVHPLEPWLEREHTPLAGGQARFYA